MPKTIRGICPDMTCEHVEEALKAQRERIKKENEARNKANEGLKKSKQKKLLQETTSVLKACESVAEVLGLPKATVRTIYRRNILEEPGSGEPTQKNIRVIKTIKTMAITGGNDIDFDLVLIDDVRYLAVQEYKYGNNGGKIKTGNHFNLTMELITEFKDALGSLDVDELKAMVPPEPEKSKPKPIVKKETAPAPEPPK